MVVATSGKMRPAIVIQADAFSSESSVTMCLVTTSTENPSALRLSVQPSVSNGLREDSWLMPDKIMTVPRRKLGRRIGALDARDMAALDGAIMAFLGLEDGP